MASTHYGAGGLTTTVDEIEEYLPSAVGASGGSDPASEGTAAGDYTALEREEFEKLGKSTCLGGRMRTPAQYMRDLLVNWPPRFIAYLGIVYLFVKGIAFQAGSAAQLPLYKDKLGVGAIDYQKYSNVANMAYGLKPLIGCLSDVFPLFGYRKRYYAAMWCLFSSVSILGLVFLPEKPESGPIAAIFFFLVVWGVAALDLLCEGKYSELMARKPKAASSIVSWAWGAFTLGSLIAACIEGPVSDYLNVYVVLWICLPLLLIPFVPSLLGWIPEGKVVRGKEIRYDVAAQQAASGSPNSALLEDPSATIIETEDDEGEDEEEDVPGNESPLAQGLAQGNASRYESGSPTRGSDKASSAQSAAVDAEGATTPKERKRPNAVTRWLGNCVNLETLKYWSPMQKRIVMVGLCTSLAAFVLAIITLVGNNTYVVLVYIVAVVLLLLTACHLMIPPAAAKAVTFFVCHNIVYLNIQGVQDYWFTSGPECIADGPHFSYSYYQTFGGIMASLSGFIGLFLFEGRLNAWSYPSVFVLTTVLKIVAALFDLSMVLRWNESIGISDEVAFIFGDKIAYQVILTLDFMPAVMLFSKICPKGVESTMYSLIAGFSNLGFVISTTFGYLLAEHLGVKRLNASESATGEIECNFDRLPELIIYGHMLLPLITIPLAFLLLPRQSMKENIKGVNGPSKRKSRRIVGGGRSLEHNPKNMPALSSPRTSTADISADVDGAPRNESFGRMPVDQGSFGYGSNEHRTQLVCEGNSPSTSRRQLLDQPPNLAGTVDLVA